ncbi:MAG TPA: hypothetical protein VG269_19125 [Tepidisphaeraceae bacterium]|jgi:hypothetical protein|nr:hypothetical protein [Tepidisphaeraceae bacterium]
MSCFTCGRQTSWRELSRAMAKLAAARFRGIGMLAERPDWPARAALCERCPLRVIRKNVSYCGTPYLTQTRRDPTDGCGCPTIAKSKDPAEHCPLDSHHRPATRSVGGCTCKWCDNATAGLPARAMQS